MPNVRLAFASALASCLLACTAAPPPEARPQPVAAPVAASMPDAVSPSTSPPSALSAYIGTWQTGEPCTNHYRWMQLREAEGVVEGRWAASMDLWGLMTGRIRATQEGAFLRTETCLETYDLPRYAAFFSECPKYAPVEGERGLRVDESTGELVLMSSTDGGVISKMKKVDAAPEPPAFCNTVEG